MIGEKPIDNVLERLIKPFLPIIDTITSIIINEFPILIWIFGSISIIFGIYKFFRRFQRDELKHDIEMRKMQIEQLDLIEEGKRKKVGISLTKEDL